MSPNQWRRSRIYDPEYDLPRSGISRYCDLVVRGDVLEDRSVDVAGLDDFSGHRIEYRLIDLIVEDFSDDLATG